MTIRRMLDVAALAALTVWTACVTSGDDVGRSCKHTSDCAPANLDSARVEECVFVDDNGKKGGVCLPIVAHKETSCANTSDCDAALFPIESTCTAGKCDCPKIEACVVTDHLKCACADSQGQQNEFCNDDADCVSGLNCRNNACVQGSTVGDRCGEGFDCVGTALQCRCADRIGDCTNAGSELGTCLVPADAQCNVNADCVGEAPFCEGVCTDQCIASIDPCDRDEECCSHSCSNNTCD